MDFSALPVPRPGGYKEGKKNEKAYPKVGQSWGPNFFCSCIFECMCVRVCVEPDVMCRSEDPSLTSPFFTSFPAL